MNFILQSVLFVLLSYGTVGKILVTQLQTTAEKICTNAGEDIAIFFLKRIYSYRKHTVHIENKTQTVILPCDFNGNSKPPKVEWTFNGKSLEKDAYGFKQTNVSLEILIPNVYRNGEYKCRGFNYFECIYSTTVLHLTFQIREKSMKNISIEEGLAAVFDCTLSADHHYANMFVFFKQRFMNESDARKTMNDLYNSVTDSDQLDEDQIRIQHNIDRMFIEKVENKHEGWYSCVAGVSDSTSHTYNFIAYKSAYLEVLPQTLSGAIISGIITFCIILVTLALVLVIVYRHMRLNKKYYERLVKIVTVRNQPNYNDYVGFQVPIVSIETRRLLTAVSTRTESAAILEYVFHFDLEWEFPREKLTLANQLGAGAFGNVVLAVAEGLLFEGVDTPVAVKMLKDEHTDDDVKDLVCEMEIMKKIGNHPNVISLLGSCTRNGPLFVIVEYAAHGNLKSFLQEHRSECTTTLTTNQLVSFASQITSGMQHLSSMKLIHRDLAARNILVCEGLIMKIADFGLARDVYDQEYYRKLTSGKLPIRWMAPESLEERFFNTKTDVWSFGVLLWEIMTLGRDPYPFVADWESFLEYLKQGHRLEQPPNCLDEIYHVMETCWEFKPENRPTFEQISAVLENKRLGNNLAKELIPRLNYANVMPETSV